jgi:hypothetical protein
VCSRSLKITALAAIAGAIWIQMRQVTLRVKVTRRLSLKCWFLGHEDWIRRGPDRLYLECFECGRETHGWTTDRTHRADRTRGAAVRAEPTRKRKNHSAPASVPSATRQSLGGKRPIADDRDMTVAA